MFDNAKVGKFFGMTKSLIGIFVAEEFVAVLFCHEIWSEFNTSGVSKLEKKELVRREYFGSWP